MRTILSAGVALTASLIGPAAVADAAEARRRSRIERVGGVMDLKLA